MKKLVLKYSLLPFIAALTSMLLISSCGGSSGSGNPTPTPGDNGQATVSCASGKLCPPSNINVVNPK